MRKIAFMSEKGGVGKTTLCINIAVALAQVFNRRVLVVDLDGVAAATRTLLPGEPTYESSIVPALLGERDFASLIVPTAIVNVWLAPGVITLKSINDMLVTAVDDERVDEGGMLRPNALALEIAQLAADDFDYLLIDCPGGLTFMERMALLACNEVIIPTGISVLDFLAISPTRQLIVQARRARGGTGLPKFLGFLPNEVPASGIPEAALSTLGQGGAPVFSAVRQSTTMKTAPGQENITKRFVVVSRTKSAVAQTLVDVAREIDMGIEAARHWKQANQTDPQEMADIGRVTSSESGATFEDNVSGNDVDAYRVIPVDAAGEGLEVNDPGGKDVASGDEQRSDVTVELNPELQASLEA